MNSKKHIIIFSHGFGVKKDDRGLFTDIVAGLPDVEPILFDYNIVDDINNTITVRPFSEQVLMLQAIINQAQKDYPDAVIDIIGHSQGSIITALAKPIGIHKIIFVAPSYSTKSTKLLDTFKSRPGTIIDFSGISKLARRDGSITIVPAQYWQERAATVDPIELYKKLAQNTELIIITANQDEVLGENLFPEIKKAKMVGLDGDHNFTGPVREKLIDTIRDCVLK